MHKTSILFRSANAAEAAEEESNADARARPVDVAVSLGTSALAEPASGRRRRKGTSRVAKTSRSSRSNREDAQALMLTAPSRRSRSRCRSPPPPPPAVLLPATPEVPAVVMEPVAVLRQCIRHFTAYPDYYGADIDALLRREVTHVLRLRASEETIAGGGARGPYALGDESTGGVDPLQTIARSTESSLLPPLAVSARGTRGGGGAGSGHGTTAAGGRPRSGSAANAMCTLGSGKDDAHAFRARLRLERPNPELLSLTRGNGAAAVTTTTTAAAETAAQTDMAEAVHWGTNSFHTGVFSADNTVGDARGIVRAAGAPGTSLLSPNDAGRVVVLDAAGYEVTYLLGQLQQVEAAYNAKSIRLHELVGENKRLLGELAAADETAARWQAACSKAQSQLEATRRDLDGWRDRATDATAMALASTTPGGGGGAGAGGRRSSFIRRAQATQLSEVKQEVSKLSQLWRETERALQESRRAFENTELEARHSHDHLSDAFHYIERLERRVARRDAFIAVCARRQASLEEKYEKLMWCFEELGAMTGATSYADYLLADEPVWTLALLVRLQRHLGYFSPIEAEALVVAPAVGAGGAAVPRLTFKPSPRRARLMDDAFDPALVYATMANEVTGVDERAGKQKRLRTNLMGTVGCRVLRWQKRYAIDFLGGEDSTPDSCDLTRKRLPLLTLGSLVLPLRRPDGSAVAAATAETDAAAATAGAESLAGAPAFPPIPHTAAYDEVTIRFVLRAFWRERLGQYRRNLYRRISMSVRAHARAERRARRLSTGSGDDAAGAAGAAAGHPRGDDSGGDSEGEDPAVAGYTAGYEEGVFGSTFLGALVAFAERHTEATGAAVPGPRRYVVRGVAARPAGVGKDTWDNGRLFFASIVDPAAAPAGAAPLLTPAEQPLRTLSGAAQELLCAVYYYTMELKDVDADFRLFYMVAHQLAPEVVGVNFFASLEAFESDCYSELREGLRGAGAESSAMREAGRPAGGSPGPHGATYPGSRTAAAITRSPLDALRHVAELVDRTPLAGETDTVAVDSDGEGYGSILPGNGTDVSVAASSARSGKRDSSATAASHRRASSAQTRTSSAKASSMTSNAQHSLSASAQAGAALVHNIREYLDKLAKAKEAGDSEGGPPGSPGTLISAASPATVGADTVALAVPIAPAASPSSGDHAKDPPHSELSGRGADGNPDGHNDSRYPRDWRQLDKDVRSALGPHAPLLRTFDDCITGMGSTPTRFFAQRRAERAQFGAVRARQLAATRGLLPLPTVLQLLSRHLFATYAVTVCGTPRFSLMDTLAPFGASGRWEDYPQPLGTVGQLPATETHLKRLRFALALDQPGGLIRFADLFSFDASTASPTHLYDELLTLWLDLAQQQQCFFMDVVQRACASRHERFMAEGAEDCDGHVPVSFLRKGMRGALGEVGIGTREADALLEHLVGYAKLLRAEDEIQSEQFLDAPFYLNAHGGAAAGAESGPFLRTAKGTASASTAQASHGADDHWDFHDEAESCSLLHMGLAVRMLYVVWGFDVAEATVGLVEALAAIPLHVPFNVYRAQHQSHVQQVRRRLSGAAARKGPTEATVFSLFLPDPVTREAVRAACFVDATKAAYTAALARLSAMGASSDGTPESAAAAAAAAERNPLRRTLQAQTLGEATTTTTAPAPAAGAGPALVYPQRLPITAVLARMDAPAATAAVGRSSKGSLRAPPKAEVRVAEEPEWPVDVPRDRREVPGSAALYALARLAGLGSPPPQVTGGKAGGKAARKPRKSGAAGAGATDAVRAGLGPVVAANLASLLRQRGELAEELQRPLEAAVAAQRTSVSGGRGPGWARASLQRADNPGAQPRSTSFVASKDVDLSPHPAGEAAGAPLSRYATTLTPAATARTSFGLDWAPPTERLASPTSASRHSSAGRTRQRGSAVGRGDGAQESARGSDQTVHVSLLHGTCAALSLL